MKNQELWTPSKFVYLKGRLAASRDSSEVNPSSRLMSDNIAALYQKYLPEYASGHVSRILNEIAHILNTVRV